MVSDWPRTEGPRFLPDITLNPTTPSPFLIAIPFLTEMTRKGRRAEADGLWEAYLIAGPVRLQNFRRGLPRTCRVYIMLPEPQKNI